MPQATSFLLLAPRRLTGDILFSAVRGSSKTAGSECVAQEGCRLIPGVRLCPAVANYLWDGSFARGLLATRAARRAAGNVFRNALSA